MSTHWLLRCLLAPAIAGLLLLGACTSGEDAPLAPSFLSEIAGTWLSTCQPETGLTGLESRLTAISMNAAGAITFHEYHWTNDACQERPAWFQRNGGTLSLPGGTVSTTFGTAYQADLGETLREITLFDPSVEAQFESYGELGAFGIGDWILGQPQDVTGLDQNGDPTSGASKTLLMRAGETLFVGDDATIVGDGYPTAVRPEVSRLPTSVVNAAGMTGEWSGACRPENNPDYNVFGGAAVEMLSVFVDAGGTTVSVTTTYYATDYCDRTGTGGFDPAPQEVRETMKFIAVMAPGADLLTEYGLATAGDLTLDEHTLTPLSIGAANALNAANDPDGAGGAPAVGAYGITGDGDTTGWIDGQTQDLAPNLQWDGSTADGPLSMRIAAVLRGDRFYVRGGEGPTELPNNAAGYPLSVGTEPFRRNYQIDTVGDLAGSWYEPCRDVGDAIYVTSGNLISGSTATRTEWQYTDDFISTCQGTAEIYNVESFAVTVVGTQSTDRGTATQLQIDNGEVTSCILMMRTGDRLHTSDPVVPESLPCIPQDTPDVHDTYSSLETTPVTTAPVSTYRSVCRQNGTDSVQYLGFHGSAVSITEMRFNASDAGPCTGTDAGEFRFSGVITFGAATTVTEGAATRIIMTDGSGATMKQIVKWMGDLFWAGDEDGTYSGDGYPEQLKPGDASFRIY